MNPIVDVTVTDHYGNYSNLINECGEPIEIYINEERVYTEGHVRQLESTNESLREFAKLAWGLLTLNEPQFVWESMLNDAHALGIEVE